MGRPSDDASAERMNNAVWVDPRYDVRRRLLEVLAARPSSTRAELGDVLGLSRSTVTALLNELDDAGIVCPVPDTERVEGLKGRPPLRIALDRGAAFAIGLHLSPRYIRAVVCDLRGAIIAERGAHIDSDQPASSSLDIAQRLAANALADAGIDAERVLGVGVGLPANVDPDHAAHACAAGRLGIESARELEDRLGLPVQLDSDANTGALGEQLFGAGRGAVRELLYVRLSDEIRLGLILDDRIYRGVSGLAGALGHVPVTEQGLICRCGGRGCLETVAGSGAMLELLRYRGEGPVSIPGLVELLEAGDRRARRRSPKRAR